MRPFVNRSHRLASLETHDLTYPRSHAATFSHLRGDRAKTYPKIYLRIKFIVAFVFLVEPVTVFGSVLTCLKEAGTVYEGHDFYNGKPLPYSLRECEQYCLAMKNCAGFVSYENNFYRMCNFKTRIDSKRKQQRANYTAGICKQEEPPEPPTTSSADLAISQIISFDARLAAFDERLRTLDSRLHSVDDQLRPAAWNRPPLQQSRIFRGVCPLSAALLCLVGVGCVCVVVCRVRSKRRGVESCRGREGEEEEEGVVYVAKEKGKNLLGDEETG